MHISTDSSSSPRWYLNLEDKVDLPKFVEKNRVNMSSTRIRQEQEIVAQMVRIYCRQKEKHTDL